MNFATLAQLLNWFATTLKRWWILQDFITVKLFWNSLYCTKRCINKYDLTWRYQHQPSKKKKKKIGRPLFQALWNHMIDWTIEIDWNCGVISSPLGDRTLWTFCVPQTTKLPHSIKSYCFETPPIWSILGFWRPSRPHTHIKGNPSLWLASSTVTKACNM